PDDGLDLRHPCREERGRERRERKEQLAGRERHADVVRVRVQSLEEEHVEERSDEPEGERTDTSDGDELENALAVAQPREDVADAARRSLRGRVLAAQHERGDERERPDEDADEDRRAVE